MPRGVSRVLLQSHQQPAAAAVYVFVEVVGVVVAIGEDQRTLGQLLVLPLVSVAEQATCVWPTANRLPEFGEHVHDACPLEQRRPAQI